jgi:hypothetical protein
MRHSAGKPEPRCTVYCATLRKSVVETTTV